MAMAMVVVVVAMVVVVVVEAEDQVNTLRYSSKYYEMINRYVYCSGRLEKRYNYHIYVENAYITAHSLRFMVIQESVMNNISNNVMVMAAAVVMLSGGAGGVVFSRIAVMMMV